MNSYVFCASLERSHDYLPKIGDLLLENQSQPFLDLLKLIFLLVGDRTLTVGCVTVNMSGAKGKAKVY